jgi:hypothetical protein
VASVLAVRHSLVPSWLFAQPGGTPSFGVDQEIRWGRVDPLFRFVFASRVTNSMTPTKEVFNNSTDGLALVTVSFASSQSRTNLRYVIEPPLAPGTANAHDENDSTLRVPASLLCGRAAVPPRGYSDLSRNWCDALSLD